jgi:hypothetical protein
LEQLQGLHYDVFFMGVSGRIQGWLDKQQSRAIQGQTARDEKFSQGLCDCRQFQMAVS